MVDPLLAGDRAPAPRTLVDVLADVASRHPDAPALDDTRRVLTYAELTDQARHLAVELAAAGVCRGDRVGVRAPSGTVDLYVASSASCTPARPTCPSTSTIPRNGPTSSARRQR